MALHDLVRLLPRTPAPPPPEDAERLLASVDSLNALAAALSAADK